MTKCICLIIKCQGHLSNTYAKEPPHHLNRTLRLGILALHCASPALNSIMVMNQNVVCRRGVFFSLLLQITCRMCSQSLAFIWWYTCRVEISVKLLQIMMNVKSSLGLIKCCAIKTYEVMKVKL
jgi:hypothetical protein